VSKRAWVIVGGVVAVLAAACGSTPMSGAGQAWQNNECQKIIDATERRRCLDSNAKTFEEFRRQQQAAGSR
jgi:hypothetical protein